MAAGVDDNESSRIDSQNLLSSDYYRGVQINLCARFFRYFFNCISVTSKHLVDVELVLKLDSDLFTGEDVDSEVAITCWGWGGKRRTVHVSLRNSPVRLGNFRTNERLLSSGRKQVDIPIRSPAFKTRCPANAFTGLSRYGSQS